MAAVTNIPFTRAATAAASAISLIEYERRIEVDERTETARILAENYVENKMRDDAPPPPPLCYTTPDSQRNWAWEEGAKKQLKQEKFIDSIMHNYPIPSVILNLVDNHYKIYDGRHRIQTLRDYRDNRFRWRGAFYRDLCREDKEKFDSRRIPITLTRGATLEQLADIFIRLNSGKKLTDSDMLWAYRDTPFMKAVFRHIISNERLKIALGSPPMGRRSFLANWAALAAGIMTSNAGNMTTSYERIYNATGGLACSDEQSERIREGINAFVRLLEAANSDTSFDFDNKRHKKMANELCSVGKLAAYFYHEWFSSSTPLAQVATMNKYREVIKRLRSTNEPIRKAMADACSTKGANNLNITKVHIVVDQITQHLEKEAEYDDQNDEEGDDESV